MNSHYFSKLRESKLPGYLGENPKIQEYQNSEFQILKHNEVDTLCLSLEFRGWLSAYRNNPEKLTHVDTLAVLPYYR